MTRYYSQTVDIGYSIVIEFPIISMKLTDMLKSMLVLRQAVWPHKALTYPCSVTSSKDSHHLAFIILVL